MRGNLWYVGVITSYTFALNVKWYVGHRGLMLH